MVHGDWRGVRSQLQCSDRTQSPSSESATILESSALVEGLPPELPPFVLLSAVSPCGHRTRVKSVVWDRALVDVHLGWTRPWSLVPAPDTRRPDRCQWARRLLCSRRCDRLIRIKPLTERGSDVVLHVHAGSCAGTTFESTLEALRANAHQRLMHSFPHTCPTMFR